MTEVEGLWERREEMAKQKYIVQRADGTEVDCPCVVFLATDVFATEALDAYKHLVMKHHPNMRYSEDIWELVCQFRLWRQGHQGRVKIPD